MSTGASDLTIVLVMAQSHTSFVPYPFLSIKSDKLLEYKKRRRKLN